MPHGSATLTLNEADPSFGGIVTFSYDAGTETGHNLWVEVVARQNQTIVYDAYGDNRLDGDAGVSGPYTLGPTALWAGGEADATATLLALDERGRHARLADTDFHVNA